MSGCKIGKVTFKDPKVVSFEPNKGDDKGRNLIDDAINTVRLIEESGEDSIDGYCILMWNKDRTRYRACWDSGVMPADCMPEFVKEKLRKEIENLEFS